MKKRFMMVAAAALLLFVCLAAIALADEPSVTLAVNGSSSNQTLLAEQNTTITIRAPGATAVRLWNPNGNYWEYYDRYWPLDYMEMRWRYAEGTRTVYADARYDDYPDGTDLGDEADEDLWTQSSNVVRLTLNAPYGTLAAPTVSLDASTVRITGWLTARVTQTLDLDEWYFADVGREDGNGDIDWLGHYDANEANVLSIPMLGYEPGEYVLNVYNAAPGYRNGMKRLNFTVRAGGTVPTGLLLSAQTSEVSVGVSLCVNVPGADHMTVRMDKQDDPNWYDRRDWGGDFHLENWSASEPGVYDITLTAWSGDEAMRTETKTVTFTVPSGVDRLSRPGLSEFDAVLGSGGLSGTIGVDDRALWLDINIDYCPTDGNWRQIYHSDRERPDGDGWTTLDLPADLFAWEGLYHLNVNTRTPRIANNGAQMSLFKAGASSGGIELTVNGGTDDIAQYDSSVDLLVSVASQSATAVRILNNDHWEYEDNRGGFITRSFGYGDGDYVFVAQMTTEEPVWREDGFDWGSFRWEDLEWTDTSNAVRVHVTSPYGDMPAPDLTVTPADGQVARDGWLTVQAADPGVDAWLWADVLALNGDPDNPRWDNIAHFDADGDQLALRIPMLAFEPGDYYLHVGMDARGWNGSNAYIPFTVEDAELPEALLLLGRDTMQANEGLKVYAYAPGAQYMSLDITWDRDAYWLDRRDTGGDYAEWGWGCGCGGEYTFTLGVFYPEGSGREPVEVVRTLTVTSEGALERPEIAGVPTVMQTGESIHGSFQAVDGADWYNVELNRCPDEGDWQMLYRDDRNPSQPGATDIDLDGWLFSAPGRYRLSVNAATVGLDNGFMECWILVLDAAGQTDGLTLSIEGSSDPDDPPEVYLYQNFNIALDVPEGVTGARVWNGQGWDYWVRLDENYHRQWGAYNEGIQTFVAQATTDQSIVDWAIAHDGDFNGLDLEGLDWNLTSNVMCLNVICLGTIDAPVAQVPDHVSRGDWLEVSFEPVANAAVYGLIILPEGGWWEDRLFDGEYSETYGLMLPTDALEPGRYTLVVEPRCYGWYGTSSEYSFTVTQPASWTGEPVFRVSGTQVETNEQFGVSVWAPGAREVIFCHENPDNRWLEGGSWISAWTHCENAERYVFRAFARYEDGGDWVQIGDDVAVEAVARYEALEGIITAPTVASADEDYTFSFTWRHMGCWADHGTVDLFDEYGNGYIGSLGDDLTIASQEGEEEDVYTFTIRAGALAPGSYRIEADMHPAGVGYPRTFVEKGIILIEGTAEGIVTNIQPEYLSQDHPLVVIYAEGAAHLSMWVSTEYPVDESAQTLRLEADGDTIEDWITFGSCEGTRHVKIAAEYPDAPTEYLELTVVLTAPYGDLPDPRIFMNGVWTQGQDLDFRVEPLSATFIYTEVFDAETEDIVFADEDINFDDWHYTIPADRFTPGRWYGMYVFSTELGYNYNETFCYLCMLPAGADTLTLPEALAEVEDEAFEGAAMQALMIPDSVASVGARAFADCGNLLLVGLPGDCSGIAGDAFEGSGPVMAYGSPGSDAEAYAFGAEEITFICLEP